jgi:hypothetical protein
VKSSAGIQISSRFQLKLPANYLKWNPNAMNSNLMPVLEIMNFQFDYKPVTFAFFSLACKNKGPQKLEFTVR